MKDLMFSLAALSAGVGISAWLWIWAKCAERSRALALLIEQYNNSSDYPRTLRSGYDLGIYGDERISPHS